MIPMVGTQQGKGLRSFPDGTFMKENEFGSATIHKLAVNLLHKGFTVFYTAPTVIDVPLKERVKTANVKGADILVSLHANAVGSGSEFSSASGVETFCYKFGGKGEKAGPCCPCSINQRDQTEG